MDWWLEHLSDVSRSYGLAIGITYVTELQRWQDVYKDNLVIQWRDLINNTFSKYSSINGKVKCSSDGLSHWLDYRIFILPLTVNTSYARKDQNFYMGTIIFLMVCLSVRNLFSDNVIMSVLYCWFMWLFPPSSIIETKPKMPCSMGLSKWILPTQLNFGSHINSYFQSKNFKVTEVYTLSNIEV